MTKILPLAVMVVAILLVSCVSGCIWAKESAAPAGEYYIEVAPGEWREIQEKSIGLPPQAEEALKKVPEWVAENLRERFEELSFNEIKLEGFAAPCLIDIDNDKIDDLVVGTEDGGIKVFKNTGTNEKPAFKEIPSPYSYIDVVDCAAPAPVDIDNDGDMDIAFGNNRGKVVLYENVGMEDGFVKFRERQDVFVIEKDGKTKDIDVGEYSVPFFFDFDGDKDLDLIVGAGDGTVHYFENVGAAAAPKWKEDKDEKDILGLTYTHVSLFHGMDVGERAAPCLYYAITGDQKKLTLLIFNSSGAAAAYTYDEDVHQEIDMSKVPPDIYESHWSRSEYVGKRIAPWPPEKTVLIPRVCDFDKDGYEDVLIGAGGAGAVHLIKDICVKNAIIYHSEDIFEDILSEYIPFMQQKSSGGYGYDLINGGTNNRTALKCVDFRYVEAYADLILRTPQRYVDEVAFVIAHTAAPVLKATIDKPQDKGGIVYDSNVLIDNAKQIYEIAAHLPYAKIVEKKEDGDYTTVSLLGRDGKWKELGKEMYYWYIVHPRCRFEALSYYNGMFWREYLFYDSKYGASVCDYVQNATSAYDAIVQAQNWTRLFFEWGEESHDKLPQEPYDANYGSCGEWSIFGVALGRTLLIPTRLANDWGEDHVWNEFYSDGEWHHWDINLDMPDAIDSPRTYEEKWGKTISTVWSIRGDDCSYEIPEKYTGTARIKIKVIDNTSDKNPIAGACVVALSEWAVDAGYDDVPWITFWNFTDEKGECEFLLGENNYTFLAAAPDYGFTSIELRDSDGKNQHIVEGKEYNVVISYNATIMDKLEKYKEPAPPVPVALKGKKVVMSAQSYQRCLHPLLYPVKNHFITGDEYKVGQEGKLAYFVCSADEFEKFKKGEEYTAIEYNNLSAGCGGCSGCAAGAKIEVVIPEGYKLVLLNKNSATWFRVKIE